MSHHHHHHTTKNIKAAFILNFAFTIAEFVGGFYTNSLAIMSDAIHDLGDSLSLGLAWYFEKISHKKPTKKYSYGYKRFSLLGALVNSIVLIVGSILIIKEAIPRIINPQDAISNAKGMMWFAIVGIVVNGAAVFKLKGSSSINQRVVSLHLLEDVLGWLAVLIASIVMQFWSVPILDPLLSLAIAAFVLFNVFKNLKDSMRIILQGTPKGISVKNIETELLAFDEVQAIHDCHLWTMDGNYNVFTAHIITVKHIKEREQLSEIKQKIRQLLSEKFQLKHVTLELENLNEDCEYANCN